MPWTYEILGEAAEHMELAICDAIGDAAKGSTSSAVRDAFKANKSAKSIAVSIHSAGGEVLDGLAIYNLLASHPAHVTVKIPTLAASIASIIAMAGDEIQIGKGAFMMVHNPYAQTKGGSEDLRKLADVLDKMKDSMVAIYSKRSGKSKEDCEKLMEAETWMTGAEAVKHGFADKLVDGPKKPSASGIAADSLKIYAKVPDEILEQLTKPNTENEAPALVQSQTGENSMDEKLKKALDEAFAAFEAKMDKKYGKKDDASSSDGSSEPKKNPFAKKADAASSSSSDGSSDMPKDKAKAEGDILVALVEANKMVAKLTAKIEGQNKIAYETRISAAVAAGKLLPSQKTWALGLSEEAFDGYLAAVGEQVFPVGKEHTENPETAKAHADVLGALSASEKKVAAGMGLTEAEVIAYNKAHPKA